MILLTFPVQNLICTEKNSYDHFSQLQHIFVLIISKDLSYLVMEVMTQNALFGDQMRGINLYVTKAVIIYLFFFTSKADLKAQPKCTQHF